MAVRDQVFGNRSQAAVNPWESLGSTLGIKLGDPARVLTLGKRHCLLPTSTNQVCVEFSLMPPYLGPTFLAHSNGRNKPATYDYCLNPAGNGRVC